MVRKCTHTHTHTRPNCYVLNDFAGFIFIFSHYFVHDCWFDDPNYILNNVEKIKNVPGAIVQGRYDMVTPIKTAWELHEVSLNCL